MTNDRNRTNQDGFTLIEVMITLFILTFAIGGMARFNIAMIKYNETASDTTTASLIAQKKIEALINTGYDSLQNGSFGPEIFTPENNKSFDIEWTVSPSGTHKEINVSVSFKQNGQKESRSVILKTNISS